MQIIIPEFGSGMNAQYAARHCTACIYVPTCSLRSRTAIEEVKQEYCFADRQARVETPSCRVNTLQRGNGPEEVKQKPERKQHTLKVGRFTYNRYPIVETFPPSLL